MNLGADKPTNINKYFQLDADDEYYACCGEIFITQKRIIVFHCSLCEQQYGSIKEYLNHIKTHYLEQTTTTSTINNQYSIIENEKEIEEFEEIQSEKFELDDYNNSLNLDLENAGILQELEFIEMEVIDVESVVQPNTKLTKKGNKNNPITTKEVQNDLHNIKNVNLQQRAASNKKRRKAPLNASVSVERKFRCNICDFAFKMDFNLRAHMRRHTGEKSHACNVCTKKFYTRSELTTHLRRHTGERPYKCSLCNSRFISSGALNEHTKRHTNKRPHKCNVCEKCFYDSFQLKEHLVVHSQVRNHICNICNASFTRRKSLGVHMRLHSKSREFICKICSASYNHKPSLLKHLKNKHPNIDKVADEATQIPYSPQCVTLDEDYNTIAEQPKKQCFIQNEDLNSFDFIYLKND